MKRRSAHFSVLIFLSAALAACTAGAATPIPTPLPSPTTTPAPATAAPTPAATPTPSPTLAPTPPPAPTPTPTPAPPAAPTAVVWTDLPEPATCPAAYSVSCFAYKVAWTEANPADVTINVYAVTKCLAKPHCLAADTPIPASDLFLIGSAAASTGSLTVVVGDGESEGDGWVNGPGGTTLYLDAVVIQASSASGTSPLVIAWAW